MKRQRQEYPKAEMVNIKPNGISIYQTYIYGRPSRNKEKTKLEELETKANTSNMGNLEGTKAYGGTLTKNAKKRLKEKINLLVAIAKPKEAMSYSNGLSYFFRLNFITLTLPAAQGKVTDQEIKKKVLQPWLKHMRIRRNLKSYIWRAERQYNGNVHFHITTDTYIPLEQIRTTWNYYLEELGYITKFKEKHGYDEPNSTDVHSIRKVKNIAAYMIKYMSKTPEEHLKAKNKQRKKNGGNQIYPERHPFRKVEGQPKWDEPIKGKVWDCSKNLKQKITCDMFVDSEISQNINQIEKKVPKQIIDSEYVRFIWLNPDQFDQVIQGRMRHDWEQYLENVRNPKPPPKSVMPEESPPESQTPKTDKQLTMDNSTFSNTLTCPF